MLLPFTEGLFRTWRCDPECTALADRHYSRQSVGHREFCGPGRTLVLRNAEATVLFVWMSQRDRYDKQEGYNCTIFRNESRRRSSEIILEAERIAFEEWGPARLFTYVDAARVKSANPGYCFKLAGWRYVLTTKKTKHLLVKEFTRERAADSPGPLQDRRCRADLSPTNHRRELMKVETYEVEEVEQATAEQCEESRALIEKLGLDGQSRFYDESRENAVCPYRKMTAQEALVYQTLLPKTKKLQNYSDGPLPLRVLQVAAHAQEVIDGELYVWSPENADVKDPVLVAQIGPDYKCERFILARWGEELEEFAVLMERTKRILHAKYSQRIAEIEAELSALKASAIHRLEQAIVSGKFELPTFYGR